MTRSVALTEPGPYALEGEIASVLQRHSAFQSSRLRITREELETIVQAAYDQHGIIATPSWTKEAEAGRAIEDAREVSDQADYLAAHDPAQTTIEEQITEADLDALRAKLTGEVR